MFYHFKQIPVTLNGNNLVAEDIQLSNEIELTPRYFVGDAITEAESPSSMWKGSLKIQYYLTGIDYLKQYIYSNKDEPISGNIGGMIFQQGYLSNYNLPIEPNSPIKINAEISFFDSLSGIFNPITAISNTGFIFRSSDVQIYNLSNNDGNIIKSLVVTIPNYTDDSMSIYLNGIPIKDDNRGFGSDDLIFDILNLASGVGLSVKTGDMISFSGRDNYQGLWSTQPWLATIIYNNNQQTLVNGGYLRSGIATGVDPVYRDDGFLIVTNGSNYTQNPINNFTRASFNYSCNIVPSYNYFDTGVLPTKADSIFLQERTIETEIVSDNINASIPLAGEKFGAIFTFSNPNNTGLHETFGCSGLISSKGFSVNTNNPHSHIIKINQYHVNKNGYIVNIITGINQIIINSNTGSFPFLSRDGLLSYVDDIYIGAIHLTGFSVNRTAFNDQIISPIPYNILDDILTVQTSYGNFIWPNKIHFSYPQITITGISSTTGSAGNIVTISGTNFVQISDVIFGSGVEALFQIINPQTITTTVPNDGITSPITVSSFYRNKNAQSNTFYYPPIITGLSPVTGLWKDKINIIGSNFSGVTGVFFNQTPSFSYSIINNNLITALTPETGQPFPSGYINVNGTGGYGQSISIYNPVIPIYSFSPLSGIPTTAITIYTKIDTGYLCSFSGGYKVRAGGIDTPFFISGGNSTGALTGTLQDTSEEDYLYIYSPNGISTSSSQSIFKVIGFPIINSISPATVNQYQAIPLTIFGQDLSFFFDNKSFIRISGGISGDIQFYQTGTFINSLDGSTLIINSLRPTGGTGIYDVYAQNVVSGFNFPQSLTINSPVNQAPLLSASYSNNGNIVSLPIIGTSPLTKKLFMIDSSYNTYGAINHPTSTSYSYYASFIPPSDTTIDISNIKINMLSDITGLQPDSAPPFLNPPILRANYSGSIVCFYGNSLVAFSGTNQILSGLSLQPSFNGITGINEIRVIAGKAPANTFLPISELEVY